MKSILFPGKFILGKGTLDSFGEYAKSLGKKFLVISSKSVMGKAQDKISANLKGTDMTADYIHFGGECSFNEVGRLSAIGKEKSTDCIVGIGMTNAAFVFGCFTI